MSPKAIQRRIESGFSLIELLIVISIIGIIAAIAVPSLQNYLKSGRETGAINSLRSIHNSQAHYNSVKNKFGTLRELTDNGFITDKSYASGQPVSQYIYSDSDVSVDTYCVHADRQSNGSGNRDFNVTEDGVVYAIESPTKGTVARGAGVPISSTETSAEPPAEQKN
jgi:prepilin-type N-terminal cleavage/methylation domain-containing protein